MLRELIESTVFTAGLKALGDPKRIDDALRGVYWGLATRPDVYDIVKGFKEIRMLKLDPLGGLPALRIWFRIDKNGRQVHLEFIEAIEPADA